MFEETNRESPKMNQISLWKRSHKQHIEKIFNLDNLEYS
jgi:hypothetical protein